MKNGIYDRGKAVAYAHKWAFGRNPAYYDFEEIGGDCTNFASQCLRAGGGVMNFTPTFGWYYVNAARRAPAWTGVVYLWNFLTRDKRSAGPVGRPCGLSELEPGDIVQLSFDGVTYTHCPVVVSASGTVLLAAHTEDADNRPLYTYPYRAVRCAHITGVLLP